MIHLAAALGWHMLVVSTTACASPAADAWMTSRSAAHPGGATWEEAVIASVDADLQGLYPQTLPTGLGFNVSSPYQHVTLNRGCCRVAWRTVSCLR